MDQRIVDLADRLTNEVDPQLGHYVLDLAEQGQTYEEITDRFRRIIEQVAAVREANKA